MVTIRVLLVDDQELIRLGFRTILEAQSGIQVVGEADDGDTALELLKTVTADVVLMDVRMSRMNGVEATRRICADGGPRVLILTTFDLDEYAYEALHAGASGFLLKDAPLTDLVSAINHVHFGNAVVAPSTTRRLLNHFTDRLPANRKPQSIPAGLDELTSREREVLVYLARGLSNAEIAGQLTVSEGTIKTHVGRILTKLGLRDRVQAVILAYEAGVVKVGDR
ncbi:response regulator transcription factor [Saccharopolyspora sp. K220]|uniref:response regulator transcription factor n=1 Tax=Saccharopolyspora soli TaxID=2926618 RepID=UPI001F56F41C|nr:response regulator transcription factor [Saccharopolyspora soli]MCI2423730.1 response regulator transcription factor [Saccharopolyspora soli]